MGSIGIIFLDYSAKSKIFNLPNTFQLLRCDPPRRASLATSTEVSVVQRSAGRWPAGGRQGTDQGIDDRRAVRTLRPLERCCGP